MAIAFSSFIVKIYLTYFQHRIIDPLTVRPVFLPINKLTYAFRFIIFRFMRCLQYYTRTKISSYEKNKN